MTLDYHTHQPRASPRRVAKILERRRRPQAACVRAPAPAAPHPRIRDLTTQLPNFLKTSCLPYLTGSTVVNSQRPSRRAYAPVRKAGNEPAGSIDHAEVCPSLPPATPLPRSRRTPTRAADRRRQAHAAVFRPLVGRICSMHALAHKPLPSRPHQTLISHRPSLIRLSLPHARSSGAASIAKCA